MSTVAVFVALGGSSYAAVKLGRGQVKSVNLANSSVTSAKVKDGSLLARDFKAGQLPQGARGQAGATGAQGPQGNPGPSGTPGKDGIALVRMTDRVEDVTVQAAQVVATIGGSASYAGSYSGPLTIPEFDSTKTYVAVLVTASALFTTNNGTSCDIRVSQNGGASFTTYATFVVQATPTGAGGSGSAAIPAFSPGAKWHFQLVCRSTGAVTLDEASIGVTAAPLS